MLVGGGIFGNDAGEIWHLFDQRFEMHLTKIDMSYFNRVDLSKYTVVIAPNSRSMDKKSAEQLKTYVQNGGILIGYRNAANWLKNHQLITMDFNKGNPRYCGECFL